MAKDVKDLEKRFWEINSIVEEIEGEIQYAHSLGCGDLIDDGVLEDYHKIAEEMWKFVDELELAWKEDPNSVSPKLAKWFDEQEKLYEEMAAMSAANWVA